MKKLIDLLVFMAILAMAGCTMGLLLRPTEALAYGVIISMITMLVLLFVYWRITKVN